FALSVAVYSIAISSFCQAEDGIRGFHVTGVQTCAPSDLFMGHTLMENRSGLIVQADLTRADGHAERRAALDMIHRHSPGSTRRLTLGADKGFDAAGFVADLRKARVTPHVAPKSRQSAIDGRTT